MDDYSDLNSTNFIAPFYHLASDQDLPHISALYKYPDLKRFKEDIQWMAKRYRFITLSELVKELANGGVVDGKSAFLSFDDGLVECYENIRPILLEMGIPATFFVNPSFIDSNQIFYRYKVSLLINNLPYLDTQNIGQLEDILIDQDMLKGELKQALLGLKYKDDELLNQLLRLSEINYRNSDIYMTSEQLLKFELDGFDIAAHSMDHPNFAELEIPVALTQISDSIDFCKLNFNQQNKAFAFPFYDFNLSKELFEKMYDDLGVEVSFGTSGLKSDIFPKSIQRLDMEGDFRSAAQRINRAKLRLGINKMLGRNTLKRD